MDNADSLIVSDAQFLPAERQMLALVAASMVPPDPQTGAPGAADAKIFADVCATLSAAVARTRVSLRRLQDLAGGNFAAADEPSRLAALETLRRSDPAQAAILVSAVLQCYYRDERVMRVLGMEPRPPFPGGFDVPDGERSLLEPVRVRAPFWRAAPD